MVTVPTFVWIFAAVSAAVAILGMLSALGVEAEHQTGLHQLRKQVIDLRCVYLRKMIESFGLDEVRPPEAAISAGPPETDLPRADAPQRDREQERAAAA